MHCYKFLNDQSPDLKLKRALKTSIIYVLIYLYNDSIMLISFFSSYISSVDPHFIIFSLIFLKKTL